MDNREKQIRLAEQLIATGIDGELKKAIENQFPELKENENERIRKMIKNTLRDAAISERISETSYREMSDYLEKQKEQKPTESPEDIHNRGYVKGVEDAYNNVNEAKVILKELAKKSPKSAEWSEEDDQYLLVCKNALSKYQRSDQWDASIISNWLENRLKSFRPQPKQEWNEATKKALDEISDYLKYRGMEDEADFIRHLRPQPHWKPSEEQMKALEQAMDRNDKLGYLLRELHDKLKNL